MTQEMITRLMHAIAAMRSMYHYSAQVTWPDNTQMASLNGQVTQKAWG